MALPNEFYDEMNRIDRERVQFQKSLDDPIKEVIYYYFPEIVYAPELIIQSVRELVSNFSMQVWNNIDTASYKVKTYSDWKLNEELEATSKQDWGFRRNTLTHNLPQTDRRYFETLEKELFHEQFFDTVYKTTVEIIEKYEKKSFTSSPNELLLLMRYVQMSCHVFVGGFYEEANEYLCDPYQELE